MTGLQPEKESDLYTHARTSDLHVYKICMCIVSQLPPQRPLSAFSYDSWLDILRECKLVTVHNYMDLPDWDLTWSRLKGAHACVKLNYHNVFPAARMGLLFFLSVAVVTDTPVAMATGTGLYNRLAYNYNICYCSFYNVACICL